MLDIYSPSYSRVEKVSGLINSVSMAEWNMCVADVHQAGPTLSITSKKLEFRMNEHPSGLSRCVNGCSSVLSLTRTRFQYQHCNFCEMCIRMFAHCASIVCSFSDAFPCSMTCTHTCKCTVYIHIHKCAHYRYIM